MIDTGEGDLSFFKLNFWDLWLQKIFRNFASVKYQWLSILCVIVTYGMFNEGLTEGQPWISATLGLGFLGGGFITLALGRLMARTSLKESGGKGEYNVHSQSVKAGVADTHMVMGDNVNLSTRAYNDPAGILDTDM